MGTATTSQMGQVSSSELIQEPLALGSQPYLDKPPISCGGFLTNQPLTLGPLHQAHHGVVPLLEELCQLGDGRIATPGKPGNTQEKLVLLGCQTFSPSGLLAKPEKASEFIPKSGKALYGRCNNFCSSRNCGSFSHERYYIAARLDFSIRISRTCSSRMRSHGLRWRHGKESHSPGRSKKIHAR